MGWPPPLDLLPTLAPTVPPVTIPAPSLLHQMAFSFFCLDFAANMSGYKFGVSSTGEMVVLGVQGPKIPLFSRWLVD